MTLRNRIKALLRGHGPLTVEQLAIRLTQTGQERSDVRYRVRRALAVAPGVEIVKSHENDRHTVWGLAPPAPHRAEVGQTIEKLGKLALGDNSDA